MARDAGIAEFMHPAAAALTLGHTALACLDGAEIQGSKKNPSPAAMTLTNVGAPSVGKSRQDSSGHEDLRRVAQDEANLDQ